MAFDTFEKTAEVKDKFVTTSEPGTVLKAFNGPTRRFKLDYVVTDADVADLPMSRDILKDRGFIA